MKSINQYWGHIFTIKVLLEKNKNKVGERKEEYPSIRNVLS